MSRVLAITSIALVALLGACSKPIKSIDIFNESGKKIGVYQVNTKTGKKEGFYEKFTNDGKKIEVAIYQGDKLNGVRRIFDDSGNLYIRSDAVIEIAARLDGCFKIIVYTKI